VPLFLETVCIRFVEFRGYSDLQHRPALANPTSDGRRGVRSWKQLGRFGP